MLHGLLACGRDAASIASGALRPAARHALRWAAGGSLCLWALVQSGAGLHERYHQIPAQTLAGSGSPMAERLLEGAARAAPGHQALIPVSPSDHERLLYELNGSSKAQLNLALIQSSLNRPPFDMAAAARQWASELSPSLAWLSNERSRAWAGRLSHAPFRSAVSGALNLLACVSFTLGSLAFSVLWLVAPDVGRSIGSRFGRLARALEAKGAQSLGAAREGSGPSKPARMGLAAEHEQIASLTGLLSASLGAATEPASEPAPSEPAQPEAEPRRILSKAKAGAP